MLSAVVAMALGALVTLAVTDTGNQVSAARPGDGAHSTTSSSQMQIALADRDQAAAWIATQVLPGTDIDCDTLMCGALQAAGVSPASLLVMQTTTQDPMGATVIVATPAVRNQFGSRLASVYAPLLLAQFGTGSQRIEVLYLAPDGTATFNASLAPDRTARIAAGEQLLVNKRVQASAAARSALLAGNVDPRLLITLPALAHEMPVHLIAFDDSSPGAAVPLRGAVLSASAPAGLSAILTFLTAQQAQYKPSIFKRAELADGQSVVTVQYDAPGWMGFKGP